MTLIISMVAFAVVFFAGLAAYPRKRRTRSRRFDHLFRQPYDVDPRSVKIFVPDYPTMRKGDE